MKPDPDSNVNAKEGLAGWAAPVCNPSMGDRGRQIRSAKSFLATEQVFYLPGLHETLSQKRELERFGYTGESTV